MFQVLRVSRYFSILLFLVVISSCSPVKFATETKPTTNTNVVTTGGPTGNIDCSPLLNGSYASVTVDSTTGNPSLAANCTPSAVSYNWTVVRGVTPVTINGLTGPNSVPDFLAAGNGTYSISLNATALGWNPYNSITPLQVIVNTTGPLPNITCNPRINGTLTSITLGSSDPTITANCTPSTVGYSWTVLKNSTNFIVPGLTGSSSTPQFITSGAGTYQLYLTAQAVGYTTYTASTPLTVTVPNSPSTTVNQTVNITAGNNKLDILLIVDDSNSMLADNQRLAARLQGFVNDLSSNGMDWQMCATLTRAQRISSADPNYYWGASVNWAGNPNNPAWILKAGTSNLSQIFTNTINAIGAGWLGTDDERGIKAAWWHLWNGEPAVAGNSGCYRQDAGLAVIVLSDEDERSIGGDQSQVFYEHERNKFLESDDLPQTYINYVRQVFGVNKRFTVNSIIVRPNDINCLQAQDAEGSKSHYGTKYNELSQLTSGYVGSICDTDYSTNLQYFRNTIITSQASIVLQCQPIAVNSVSVTPNYAYTTSVSANLMTFNPQIPVGSTVQLQYVCP